MVRESIQKYLEKKVSNWSGREKLAFIVSTGIFISLFLLFFQPFGVNNYDPSERISSTFLILMSVMGLWTMVLLSTNEFLIRKLLRSDFTRLHVLFWILWSVLWLSGGIFLLYNYLGGWHDFSLSSYFEFILNVGIMMLIPLSGLWVYFRIRNLNQSLEQAYRFAYKPGSPDRLLTVLADNQKDRFTLPLQNLLFVESEDNYIAIHYLLNGATRKELVRKSLKTLEAEKPDPALLRVHRSFLINKMHLQSASGNRNKLSIHLQHIQHPIPVGSQYMNAVFELALEG